MVVKGTCFLGQHPINLFKHPINLKRTVRSKGLWQFIGIPISKNFMIAVTKKHPGRGSKDPKSLAVSWLNGSVFKSVQQHPGSLTANAPENLPKPKKKPDPIHFQGLFVVKLRVCNGNLALWLGGLGFQGDLKLSFSFKKMTFRKLTASLHLKMDGWKMIVSF